MSDTFASWEARLRRLVEDSLPRLLGGAATTDPIGAQFLAALATWMPEGDDPPASAPDRFLMTMNPADLEDMQTGAQILERQLTGMLHEAAAARGIKLAAGCELRLVADNGVPRGACRLMAWPEGEAIERTMTERVAEPAEEPPAPPGAFLIVDGKDHIALRAGLISIGRRLENSIPLDSPQVSRAHAQIRLRAGRYVLFDLGSATGTQVNGRPITEWLLHSGDVIAIADHALVYGEDPIPSSESTGAFTPVSRTTLGDEDVDFNLEELDT